MRMLGAAVCIRDITERVDSRWQAGNYGYSETRTGIAIRQFYLCRRNGGFDHRFSKALENFHFLEADLLPHMESTK